MLWYFWIENASIRTVLKFQIPVCHKKNFFYKKLKSTFTERTGGK